MNEKEQSIQLTDAKLADLEKRVESINIQLNGKNLVIASLLKQSAALNSRIIEIENSTAWKLVKYLWKIRLFFIPHGSRREKIGQQLIQLLQKANIRKKNTVGVKISMVDTAPREHVQQHASKPRIGYVIPSAGVSGGIAVVFQHANRLLQRGYDITLISENNQTDTSWYPNQLVEVIPLGKVAREYDILVATGWSTAYPVAELTAGRKYYFVQSDERRFFQGGAPEVLRAWDTYKLDFEFLTMARWIQTWLRDEFGKDAVYLPNGLDERIFFPTEPIAPKGEKARVLLEGAIGVPYKGMEDAFRAVDGLDCEVWCVSAYGRPKPEWKCDRFFERVPWDQMRHIYSSCDILLKMSRVESFSMPPLEMMACGGTAVVGKVTGIDEYIIDNYNALVVEQGDVDGAHNALSKLIENNEFRLQLTRNGKITASKWKWEPTIDVLERLINKQKL
ncbi:MAG: glycosyltransferase family 4 protein [Chloroflexi bacterium]|nr:glycosyltransferase family 4 protein [Chloroflexota bacterium]